MSFAIELPELDPELAALLHAPVEPPSEPEGLAEGAVVTAVVHEVTDEHVYVRLAEEAFGRCTAVEALLPGDVAPPEVGAELPVLVERALSEGLWEVSLAKGRLLALHEAARAWVAGAPVEGTITLVLRGGFAVDVRGIRCFLPGKESGVRQADAFRVVGATMTFDVTRIDERHGFQPVLSRKRHAAADRRALEAERISALEVGQVIEGVVSSIQPFGVFIDLGGVDGLCHVSELSLKHVDHPNEIVQLGDRLAVRVTELDAAKGRVGVSRRDLLGDAQRARVRAIEAGSLVTGTVTRLADFGAFVQISDGIEGLCHVSELSWTSRPSHPSEVLEVGQEVSLRVVSVDPDSGRIALSLKAVTANPWTSVTERAPAGSVAEGTITRIEDYGLFVRLEEGVEGLCHVSDLTWTGRPDRPSDAGAFAVGQPITVKVLSIDTDRGRIALGLKQLSADPWDAAGDRTTTGTVFRAPVVRFDDKSAYLQVAEGLEGRLYIAEVSTERIDSIRAALRLGQEVEVMTIAADRAKRRLDLSIKAILAKIEAETPKSYHDDAPMNPMAVALAKKGLAGDATE